MEGGRGLVKGKRCAFVLVVVTLLVSKRILLEDKTLLTSVVEDFYRASAKGSSLEMRIPNHWKPPIIEERLELPILSGSFVDSSTEACSPPLLRFNDTIPAVGDDHSQPSLPSRRIPRIIHFTSKSRCLTPQFVQNLQKWRFPNHAVYLHDDTAVEQLLQRHWPQFPHLHLVRSCLLSGAAKADLWRGVILYEYGGIYSDIDNAPNKFHAETTIQADDEAFFVVESVGVVSQWFMCARPKHPLMYLLVSTTLQMLMKLPVVDQQYVPKTTGPGALKIAMMHFMDAVKYAAEPYKSSMSPIDRWQRVKAGTYTGLYNATVRIVGRRGNENQWVRRNVVTTKRKGYKDMNMTHFSAVKPKSDGESCLLRMYRRHEMETQR